MDEDGAEYSRLQLILSCCLPLVFTLQSCEYFAVHCRCCNMHVGEMTYSSI